MWKENSLIDLTRLKLRDYAKCFLLKNPFPSIGIPEDIPPITVDRDSIIHHFQDVITHLYQDGSSTVTVLVGDYGSGKSHLLKVFKNSVNSQLLQLEKPTLAVFVKSPGRNFLDFVFAFIDDLGKAVLTNFSNKIIRDFLEEAWSKSSRYIHDSNIKAKFEKREVGVDSLLRSSRFLDLFSDIRKQKFQRVRHQDLVSAFLCLSHPDYSSIAWRWFLGQTLSRDEKDLIDVKDSLDNDKEAYSLFQSFVELLHSLGISSLVILVDELEKTVLIPALGRSQYQDDLRHLIDDNPKGMAMFFAIAFAQWEQFGREPTALQRRLAGNIFNLDKFDRTRTRSLIEAYLEINRTTEFTKSNVEKSFPKCPPKLAPFTEESIEDLLTVSLGKVSDLIGLCRKVVDYFLDHSKDYTEINSKLLTQLAKKEGY